MDASSLVQLYYLRRLVSPAETPAQALDGVKADLRRARAYLDAIADKRELERDPAAIAAEDAAEAAARAAARAEADAVDAWLRTAAGAKHLRKSFAEQLAAAKAAGVV